MNSASPVAIYWFRRWGWFYRPIHPFGYLTTLAAPTFLGWAWIGSRTSGEDRGGGQ